MLDETLAYEAVGDVMVCVHGESEPSDGAWNQFLAVCLADMASGSIRRVIVSSDGGAPNATQRRLLTESDSVPTAVLTDSKVAKGASVVLRWFGKQIAVFEPDRVDEALEYLDITSPLAADVREALARQQSARRGR